MSGQCRMVDREKKKGKEEEGKRKKKKKKKKKEKKTGWPLFFSSKKKKESTRTRPGFGSTRPLVTVCTSSVGPRRRKTEIESFPKTKTRS